MRFTSKMLLPIVGVVVGASAAEIVHAQRVAPPRLTIEQSGGVEAQRAHPSNVVASAQPLALLQDRGGLRPPFCKYRWPGRLLSGSLSGAAGGWLMYRLVIVTLGGGAGSDAALRNRMMLGGAVVFGASSLLRIGC